MIKIIKNEFGIAFALLVTKTRIENNNWRNKMNNNDLNEILNSNDMMTLDDLLITMDSYDTSVYTVANEDYYGGVIAADDNAMVLN